MVEEEAEFVTHWCPTCGGVSHPATGCVYTPTFIVCNRCTREAWQWIEQFTNSKGRRPGASKQDRRGGFYAHVNAISPRIDVSNDPSGPSSPFSPSTSSASC